MMWTMTMTRLFTRSAVAVLAANLIACQGIANGNSAAAAEGTKPPPSRNTMKAANPSASVRTLIVSRSKEGRLGTLRFDESNQVSLVTEGAGPAVEELKKAWAEISKKAKVTWVKAVVEESAGKKVTAIEAEEFGREDANYFYAVLDTLSRQYGFSVDSAK